MVGKKFIAVVIVAIVILTAVIWYNHEGKNNTGDVIDRITALDALQICMDEINYSSNTHALKHIAMGNTTPIFDGLSENWRFTFWEYNSTSNTWATVSAEVFGNGLCTCVKSYLWGMMPDVLLGIPPRLIFLDSDEVARLLHERIQNYPWAGNVTGVNLNVLEAEYYQNGNPIAYPVWTGDVYTSNGDSYTFNIDAEDGYITQSIIIPSTDPDNFIKGTNTKIVVPDNNTNVSGVINITSHIDVCYCSSPTFIFVDGKYYGTGIMNGTSGEEFTGLEYEIYNYELDTTEFDNGMHRIVVLGKHTQYGDEVYLNFQN